MVQSEARMQGEFSLRGAKLVLQCSTGRCYQAKISIPVLIAERERRKTAVKGNISPEVFCIVKSFTWGYQSSSLRIFFHTEFGLSCFSFLQGTKPIHMPAQREHYYTSHMQPTYLPQASLIFVTLLNRLDYYVIFYRSTPVAFGAIWPRCKPCNELFFTPFIIWLFSWE